jgi:hypothetical protein
MADRTSTPPDPRPSAKRTVRPGDWLELRGLPGCPSRRGEIEEVLGRPGHERYRVRWDEEHESIVYPAADGVHVTAGHRGR